MGKKNSIQAKYSLSNPDGMYTTAFAVIMNNDTYNDLSASHKKCIDDMRVRVLGSCFQTLTSLSWMISNSADISIQLVSGSSIKINKLFYLFFNF